MEAGFTGTSAMGQNPAAQDLIGTVSSISNSLMNEVGKVELHPKFDGKQMIMVIQPL